MNAQFKNILQEKSKLYKDALAPIPGRYFFNGPNVYGLLYLQIPDDCRCIALDRLDFKKDCGEIYPMNTTLTSSELKQVNEYMKKLGFKFSRGSKRLDQGASCFLGSVCDGHLEGRLHVYYYYYKQDYLDELQSINIVE